MKEYTLWASVSVLLAFWLDKASGMGLLKRRGYYFFILVIFFFKALVNGYLTGRRIVIYDPRFYLGVRIGSIPVEDFLFGFSMITLTIVSWEYFKKRERR